MTMVYPERKVNSNDEVNEFAKGAGREEKECRSVEKVEFRKYAVGMGVTFYIDRKGVGKGQPHAISRLLRL